MSDSNVRVIYKKEIIFNDFDELHAGTMLYHAFRNEYRFDDLQLTMGVSWILNKITAVVFDGSTKCLAVVSVEVPYKMIEKMDLEGFEEFEKQLFLEIFENIYTPPYDTPLADAIENAFKELIKKWKR